MSNQKTKQFIKENKTIFIIIAIGLFLIELEIFALASVNSGRKLTLQVMNSNGDLIHEADGKNLSEFNKYYFERTFGPFENYEVKLKTQDKPFPFRIWLVAALGIPIGSVLLFSFVAKVYTSFFQMKSRSHLKPTSRIINENKNKIDVLFDKVTNMNIFLIGLIAFIVILSYWIIPNMISYIGINGINVLVKFKWGLILIIVCLFLIGIWIAYLRYCLAKKDIESRIEIEKYKIQLKLNSNINLLKLENNNNQNE